MSVGLPTWVVFWCLAFFPLSCAGIWMIPRSGPLRKYSVLRGGGYDESKTAEGRGCKEEIGRYALML